MRRGTTVGATGKGLALGCRRIGLTPLSKRLP